MNGPQISLWSKSVSYKNVGIFMTYYAWLQFLTTWIKDGKILTFFPCLQNGRNYCLGTKKLTRHWFCSVCRNGKKIEMTFEILPPLSHTIWEWIYEVIVSPKRRTKNCQDFCPHYTGQKPWQFLFVFWEKWWLH